MLELPKPMKSLVSMSCVLVASLALASRAAAQRAPDWAKVEEETLRHFQALVRLDTSNPPGNESRAADYLQQVLEAEGIPVQRFALDPARPNVVARLSGNGRKRPLLIVGHTDVVTVEPSKWTFPPFSAQRDGGWIYGRGTVDDKDNLTGSLMMMLLLKRLNVPLDRDVIFLAESGEEGGTNAGMTYMVDQHFPSIDAEYCLAEGGGLTRANGQVRYASVGVLEKVPRTIELVGRGPSGHGSIPLRNNAVAHLSAGVAAVAGWDPPVRLNEVTREFFRRLATISSPEDAKWYRDVLSSDPAVVKVAVDHFEEAIPSYAAILHTSASPTILEGGNRFNVIPSEVHATIDVRLLPDDDPNALVDRIRDVVKDTAVEVRVRDTGTPQRQPGGTSIGTEAFRAIEAAVTKNYGVITLPTMGTGATDMAFLRPKGMQCYGIGSATDLEDGPKGFGAHSDQERIIEAELYRFVRFYWDVVTRVAGG